MYSQMYLPVDFSNTVKTQCKKTNNNTTTKNTFLLPKHNFQHSLELSVVTVWTCSASFWFLHTSHNFSSVCPPGSIAIIVPLVLLVILIVTVVAGVYICRRRQRYVDKNKRRTIKKETSKQQRMMWDQTVRRFQDEWIPLLHKWKACLLIQNVLWL